MMEKKENNLKSNTTPEQENKVKPQFTEVENAHASGDGSLEKDDEKWMEKEEGDAGGKEGEQY